MPSLLKGEVKEEKEGGFQNKFRWSEKKKRVGGGKKYIHPATAISKF